MKKIIMLFVILTNVAILNAQYDYGNQGVIYSLGSKVGIGTSQPTHDFEVISNGVNSFKVKNTIPGSANGSRFFNDAERGMTFTSYGSTYSAGSYFGVGTDNGALTFNQKAVIGTTSNDDLGIGTNGVTSMTIKNNGNVGIGTITPSAKFEVESSNSIAKFKSTGNTSFLLFENNTGNISYLGSNGDNIFQKPASGNVYTAASGKNNQLYVMDYETGGNSYGFLSSREIRLVHTSERKVSLSRDGVSYFNAGNVGIGTVSPQRKFDLLGPFGAQFRISDSDADATYKHSFLSTRHYSNAEQDFIWSIASSQGAVNVLSLGGGTSTGNAATSLDFYTAANNITTSGTKRMTIDKNGNIGMGTSTPSAKLNVEHAGSTFLKLETTSENHNSGIQLFGKRSTGLTSAHFIGTDGPSSYNLAISVDENLFVKTNGVDRLYVGGTGLVGIGTTTPNEKLEITGNVYSRVVNAGSAEAQLILENQGGLDGGSRIDFVQSTNKSRGSSIVSQRTSASNFDSNLAFYTDSGNGSGRAERMRITTDGNVNIGTIELFPDYKLSVAGKGRFVEVKVQPEIEWMDIVFEKDYDLRSLEEVKKYIDENGHLPDIPSAEEVKKNGFSLGEMDANLLRKIEELTLYLIEKEEKIDKIMQANEDLISRLERIEQKLKN